MLFYRLRRWPKIKTTAGQRFVFDGIIYDVTDYGANLLLYCMYYTVYYNILGRDEWFCLFTLVFNIIRLHSKQHVTNTQLSSTVV